MKELLGWLAAAYIAKGIYEAMTSADGQSYGLNCPTVFTSGTVVPPECSSPPPCSNRTIEHVLKWPMWNNYHCNTNF